MFWPNKHQRHRVGEQKVNYRALEHPAFTGWAWGAIKREPSPSSKNSDFEIRITQAVNEMEQAPMRTEPRAQRDARFPQKMGQRHQDSLRNPLRMLPGCSVQPSLAFKQLGNFQYHTSTTSVSTRPPPGFPPHVTRRPSSSPQLIRQQTYPPSVAGEGTHQAGLNEAQPMMTTRSNHQEESRRDPRARRNLSPHDIGVLADRASRRNSPTSLDRNMGASSENRQPHLSQDIFSIQNSTSPLNVTQYGQRTTIGSVSLPPPAFRLPRDTAAARDARAIRPRHRDNRQPGYALGLDSNMPSQLPRNPQEAAIAARAHTARVRAMQLNLASDPNVILPQSPGPSTQLVAVGPPLTGHDTTSASYLPSVLDPVQRQPTMSYKEGLDVILNEMPLLFRLTQLEPQAVSVVFYDDISGSLGVSEGLVLSKDCDVKALVTFIQEILDEVCDGNPTLNGGRLLVKYIEIRNGTQEPSKGYPALKGECMKSRGPNFTSWIRWITGADMEKYWEAYRIVLQTQAPQPGSKQPVQPIAKPIFKVRTVRQILEYEGSFKGGHEYVDLSDHSGVAPTPATVSSDDRAREDGSAVSEPVSVNHTPRENFKDPFTSLSQGIGQLNVGDASTSISSLGNGSSLVSQGVSRSTSGRDAAGPSFSLGNDGTSSNGSDAPESGEAKDKPKPFDITKTWGYYQRMGGDPRMWKLYDLSHIPLDAPIPDPKPDSYTTPDIIVRIRDAWNENDAEDPNTPRVSDGHPVSPNEMKWRAKAAAESEAAINFEDDDSFFPNYNSQMTDSRKVPDHHKIVAQRLLGQQHSAKGKGKGQETEPNNFFNGYYAPDGSQDHFILSGFNSQPYDVQGMTKETDTNSFIGGYNSPGGSQNITMDPTYEVWEYDGEGKPSMTHDDSSKASFDPGAAFVQNLTPSCVHQSNQSVMAMNAGSTPASSAKSPHTKTSSMNVHAPVFPGNYNQLVDKSNMNSPRTLSPYLQSLVGPQPAYTWPNPYGCMLGQAGSNGPDMQYSSPIGAGNREPSIQKSSSSAALFPFNYQSQLGTRLSYPQNSSSSVLQSPDKPQTASNNSSPGPAYSLSQPMFNNTGAFSVPRYDSPEKSMMTNTGDSGILRHSPDKQVNQRGRGSGQRSRSAEKFGPRLNTTTAPTLRYTSLDKSNFQQCFNTGLQFGLNNAMGSMMRYPSPEKSNTQQGFGAGFQNNGNNFSASTMSFSSPEKSNTQQCLGSGFQYGQNTPQNFDFFFHLPSQGTTNFGAMDGSGQGSG